MRTYLLAALMLSSCATSQHTLPDRIARYYPPDSGGIMGIGRDVYIRNLFDLKPESNSPDSSYHNFYHAYRSDEESFVRFLNSEDRDIEGEPGERWISDTVVLVLAHEDTDLHRILSRVDPSTRNYVCYLMTVYLRPEDLAGYPLTMEHYDPREFEPSGDQPDS
ncbi:hypothetical protein ACFQY0_03810 [Haloferula chungangensis]|uniref:Lipoprotein n=1 Tax=Haloferula chungangensis TaxID=1048331 RepID=A0ABW2L5A3_9BACT